MEPPLLGMYNRVVVMHVLMCIGALSVLKRICGILVFWYRNSLRKEKNLLDYGKWAVVTGSTDGIGKEYALQLAKRGLNIILISRTQSRLDETRAEILKKHPKVDVESLVVDFSSFDDKDKANVTKAIKDKEVGLLINNVGVSYKYPKLFTELSDEETKDLVSLNIMSAVDMTRIVLPGMLDRTRGAIVNMSSSAALFATPLLSLYSGTKGMLVNFSKSLDVELRRKGVSVQCQVPLYVTTKLSKIRHASWGVPSPKDYVKQGIRHIGYESTTPVYGSHKIQIWFMRAIPECMINKIIHSTNKNIGAAGKRKEERKKR
eukprot:454728_1